MDAFALATRRKFRFASPKGDLSVEQLWDLPLTATGANAGSDLDSIAMALDTSIEKMGKRSFVNASPNPAKDEASAKLAVVVAIIEAKKADAAADAIEREKAAKRNELRDAIREARTRKLSEASVEDLERQLAAVG